MTKNTPLLGMMFKVACISISILFVTSSSFAQDDTFQYAYNGTWDAGNVKVNPEIECLDVKNGVLASFKMILLMNGGTSVQMFEIQGGCFGEKAMAAIQSAPAGTQIMFSNVQQVGDAGARIDASGKNYIIIE
jgi:hypothetical protein